MEDTSELNLVGRSASFVAAVDLIRKFATCRATVLIQGETGTGKELAARAIHYLGDRRSHPFIPVNCGALPDTLIENELFGHARGAYTDAREGHSGMVQRAEGGTLFLDEIEAISAKGQVVLLRFLQDGVYRPLGAHAAVAANVRVVAASNVSLPELVRSGAFRQDLLYRLAILTVTMPALRDRAGDVELLANHVLRRLAAQYHKPKPAIDPASIGLMTDYRWPGNVRELENVMHREFLLCDGPRLVIGTEHLPSASRAASPSAAETLCDAALSFAKAKAHAIAQFERSYLQKALSAAEGNITLAASRCGKERRSFGKLLKKYGIERGLYSAG
jgi:two-component system response regulator GlrR